MVTPGVAFTEPKAANLGETEDSTGRQYAVGTLTPHPALTRLGIGSSTQELSILSQRGDAAYLSPVLITQDNVILDGLAVWHLAKLKDRHTLLCLTRHMTEEEALLYIIDKNRASKGINDFNRVLMALELEPWFKLRAKANQRYGGMRKGSSGLTEVESLDVRIEIASAAGVSVGNVSKVKQILRSAIPEIQQVLRTGEISINKGAEWAEAAAGTQRNLLESLSSKRGIRRTIRILLDKHETRRPRFCDGLRDVQRGLRKFQEEPSFFPLLPLLEQLISGLDLLLNEAEADSRAA